MNNDSVTAMKTAARVTFSGMVSTLTEQQLTKLRKQLLRKGADINAQLVELLSGRDVDTTKLPSITKPGERPAERLRRFLDLIDRRLHQIKNGSYGRCDKCDQPIPFESLEQMPWADVCQGCAEDPDDGKEVRKI